MLLALVYVLVLVKPRRTENNTSRHVTHTKRILLRVT